MGVKQPCKVDDCPKPSRGLGLCDTHYRRFKRNGTTDILPRVTYGCSVDGCPKPHQARGLCATHYKSHLRNEWRGGKPKGPSTRTILPLGEDLPVAPLVAYLDSLGGLAEATAWMGSIKSTPVERWKRNIERAKVRGHIDAGVADEFCCRVLRIHPFFIWGEIWWDFEDEHQQAAA